MGGRRRRDRDGWKEGEGVNGEVNTLSLVKTRDQFVYVCEYGNKCLSVFKTSGEFVTSFGKFGFPAGIVIDDDGFVCVADYLKYRIDIL